MLARAATVAGRLLAAAALLLTACSGAGLDALPSAGTATAVSAERDGRVVLNDGRMIALAGIEVAGAGSLDRLVRGQDVELLTAGPDPDVAHLRLKRGRRWVQGDLLDRGLARVRTRPGERVLAKAMLTREARARARGQGRWGDSWRVLTAEEALDARGFQVVEGRVRAAKALRRGVFLDFGRNWREDVSVSVPNDAADDFAAAGIEPEALAGRLVRVRGRLEPTRNGPLIELDHPEALELLDEP